MHYIADSLHYQPQGMYIAAKWGEVGASAEGVRDPFEVTQMLSDKYGIEVIG
jgi:hypothetical protein